MQQKCCSQFLLGLRQLRAILKKNLQFKRRRIGATLLEIFFPCALFGITAWIFTLGDTDSEGNCFYPSFPVFPLDAIPHSGVFLDSQAKCEVEVLEGGTPNTCASPPINYSEDLLKIADYAVACSIKETDDSLRTFLRDSNNLANQSNSSRGELRAEIWRLLQDTPEQAHAWLNESVDRLINIPLNILDILINIPKHKAAYLGSHWPVDIKQFGRAIQNELHSIRSWHNFRASNPTAPFPSNLTDGSYIAWSYGNAWDRTKVATFLVEVTQWVEKTFDVDLRVYVTGMFGMLTTGWMHFAFGSVKKAKVKRAVNEFYDKLFYMTGALRNATQAVQNMDSEILKGITKEIDDFIWYVGHFLEKDGDGVAFIRGLSKLDSVIDVPDQVLDQIFGESSKPVLGSLEERPDEESLTRFVRLLVLRLQARAPDILAVISKFEKWAEDVRLPIMKGLVHILTKDFFNALKAAERGNIQVLKNHYLPWVEDGWRSRCPFRRDWLNMDTVAELYDGLNGGFPLFKMFVGTFDLNITDAMDQAHDWMHDVDLSRVWRHANDTIKWIRNDLLPWASAKIRVVTQVQANARQWWFWSPEGSSSFHAREPSSMLRSDVAIGDEWVVLNESGAPVFTIKDLMNESGEIKPQGAIIMGRQEENWVALLGEIGYLESASLKHVRRKGLSEALSASLRQEYFQQRQVEIPVCEKSNNDQLLDLFAKRSVLVAPYTGESHHLMKLVFTELSRTILTLRGASEGFLADVAGWPVTRAAFALGAYELASAWIKPLASPKSLDDYATESPEKVIAAIAFKTANETSGNFPKESLNVEYGLRLHAMLAPQTSRISRIQMYGAGGNTCTANTPYYERGLLFIQDLFGRAVLRLKAWRHAGGVEGRSKGPPNGTAYEGALRNAEAEDIASQMYKFDLRMEQTPHPATQDTPARAGFQRLTPVLIVASFAPAMSMHVKELVYDKQEKLREVMRIMGMKSWVYWFGQPIAALLQLLFSVALMLHVYMPLLPFSSWSVVYFIFYVWSISVIAFASFVATFFRRATVAAPLGCILFYGTMLPLSLFLGTESSNPFRWAKRFYCLLPATTGGILIVTLTRWEREFVGVQWSNLHEEPRFTNNGKFVPGLACLDLLGMMVFDTVLYIFLAWYVDQVSPGTFGIPRPWYFPFLASFWFGSGISKEREALQKQVSPMQGNRSIEFQEDEKLGLPIAVEISGVSKVYPNGKLAVEKLSFDMHQGNIVGLLGHNGAGKSTTMAIITGLYPPTVGDVLIHGVSVTKHPHEVRQHLGMCLQHSALHDTLTAKEHLNMFAALKGVGSRSVREEVKMLLEKTQLMSRRNALAGQLSNGMRRCLSIGCALIGGSSVLILDEPTAGVDAATRREIWKLLIASKASRTMLLSTHLMEEAEALCDRIAVVKEGKLTALGSCGALKRHFGGSYTMHVTTASEDDEEQITFLAKASVPSAALHGSRDRQLCYDLPTKERKGFPALLDAVGKASTACSIHDSTLEVVFPEAMLLWQDSWKQSSTKSQSNLSKEQPFDDKDTDYPLNSTSSPTLDDQRTRSCCGALWAIVKQFGAIYRMRFITARRSKKLFFSQWLVPTGLVLLHVTLIRIAVGLASFSEPPLKMHTDMFKRILNPEGGQEHKLFIPCSSELLNASLGRRICDVLSDSAGSDADVVTLGLNTQNSSLGKYQLDHTRWLSDNSVGGVSILEARKAEATVMLWFTKRAYHSVPIMMNLWSNARFRMLGLTDTKVQMWNHPLPDTQNLFKEEPTHNDELTSSILLMTTTIMTMLNAISPAIVYSVADRELGSKHQQLVTGVAPITYWIANFAFEMSSFAISVAIIVSGDVASGLGAFSGENLLPIIVLNLTCGLAVFPQMFIMGRVFNNDATAHVAALSFNMFTGLCSFSTMWAWNMYSWSANEDFSDLELSVSGFMDVCGTVFQWLIPQYCVGRGLLDMIINHYRNKLYYDFGICMYSWPECTKSPFMYEVAGKYMISMLVNAIVYFTVVWLIDSGLLNKKRCASCKVFDAICGRLRFGHGKYKGQYKKAEVEPGLVFDNVHKLFASGCGQETCHAVRGLTATMAPGECFGIVGTNGAGKTTTLKLVTGSIQPTSGDIYVKGKNVALDREEVRRNLGFCPQYDALPEVLTTRETLSLYISLRGHCRRDQQKLLRDILRKTHLEAFEHTQTRNLSGGNKRKLSAAMALIGSPSVVLLDEPSAGVDVHARRMLWSVLQETKQQDCLVVLTSHSMEECMALCTRVSVMIAGGLHTPRPPANLECEQGERYTLIVEAAGPEGNDRTLATEESVLLIRDFVAALIPSATFSEDQCSVVRCEFQPVNSLAGVAASFSKSVADVFRAMEEAMAFGGPLYGMVSDYSLSQVSVEDVLLEALQPGQEKLQVESRIDIGGGSIAAAQAHVQPEVIGAPMQAADASFVLR